MTTISVIDTGILYLIIALTQFRPSLLCACIALSITVSSAARKSTVPTTTTATIKLVKILMPEGTIE
jgi:hypothetical protein